MLQDLHRGSGSGQAGRHRLKWWICFSGVLHLALIVTLLAAPPSTARRDSAVPVYTVDLVAGDEPAPPEPEAARKPEPPRKQEVRAPVVETAAPETVEAPKEVPLPPKVETPVKKPPEKKVAKPKEAKKAVKKAAKPKKPKKARKVAKPKKLAEPKKAAKRKPAKPRKEKAAARKKAAKPEKVAKPGKAAKPQKAREVAKRKRSDDGDSKLAERLKQRRRDAAVATARERARMRRDAGGARSASGSGAGNGAGGFVRSMEFVAYFNRMRGLIRESWTWPRTWIPKPGSLEVTVGFGVRVDGEIFGVELLRRSGDASFDESVVRAVRRASPLPPPPRSHARDFAQVELTFLPNDLDGQAPSG